MTDATNGSIQTDPTHNSANSWRLCCPIVRCEVERHKGEGEPALATRSEFEKQLWSYRNRAALSCPYSMARLSLKRYTAIVSIITEKWRYGNRRLGHDFR